MRRARWRGSADDDGPGIPDPARAHLFEPFAASTNTGGTGLGLVTARDLVRAHEGELLLVSSDRNGTCFRIELPTAPLVSDNAARGSR